MANPRVLVVEDDPHLRSAIQALLHTVGLEATGYADGGAFLADFGANTRGCVLLDLRLPGIGGMAVLERVVAQPDHPPVVMISGHGSIRVAVRALASGAFDFLEKPIDDQLLIDTVQAALAADAENERRRSLRSDLGGRLESLSPRERQVFERVVEGRMNKQIAGDLAVCVNTVEVHRAAVMRKLRVRSVAELVSVAFTLGLAPAPHFEQRAGRTHKTAATM